MSSLTQLVVPKANLCERLKSPSFPTSHPPSNRPTCHPKMTFFHSAPWNNAYPNALLYNCPISTLSTTSPLYSTPITLNILQPRATTSLNTFSVFPKASHPVQSIRQSSSARGLWCCYTRWFRSSRTTTNSESRASNEEVLKSNPLDI